MPFTFAPPPLSESLEQATCVVIVYVWSLTEFTTQVQRSEAINNFVHVGSITD